jgi:hypothetical protein
MSKRFERLWAKAEALALGAVLVVLVIAYLASRFTGDSAG